MRLSALVEMAKREEMHDPIIAIEGKYGQPIDVRSADPSVIASPEFGIVSLVILSADSEDDK